MPREFSTADLREGRPVDAWRAWLSNEFLPVDVQDYDPRGFHARCELTSIGEIDISTFRGTSQSIVRPHSLIRPSHADVYVAAVTGTKAFDHNGISADTPGGIVLFDVTRPYLIAHDTDVDVLCVAIPRKLLDDALGLTRAATGLLLDSRSANTRIIRDFFQSLARNSASLEPSAARRMATIGIDLIAAGFAEKLALEPPQRASQVAMVMRARAFIEDNIADPQLDVPRIAAGVRVSPRRLFEIFAAQQISVMDYLFERRLARARKLLADRARDTMTIGSIASQVGFANQAHFARRFKARFGITPSDFRDQGRSAVP